ncbi:g10135 [Coccomyxa elongata]
MAGNVFWAFLVHWCFLFIVSVRAVDVVSEPLPNSIQNVQDLSSKIVTAANGSDTIPGNVLPPAPLPYLPGVPLQPGNHARRNLTLPLSGGPGLAPEAATAAAVVASAPAAELAQLLSNFTAAAAAAPAPSPVASPVPAPAPGPAASAATALAAAAAAEVPSAAAFAPAARVNASLTASDAAAAVAPAAAVDAPGAAALAPAAGGLKASDSTSAQQPSLLNASIAAANASAAASAVRSFQAAASSAVSAVTHSGAGNSTELPSLPLPSKPNANSTETGAIKDLVVASVKLGAALGESGKVTLLAADQRENFAAQLKGDFETLSLAIANLPVGIIPFPDKARAALQKLNTDIVHGVTTGNLDVVTIAADKDAVAAALAPVTDGTTSNFGKLQ